jgi:carotenoid cleavage dioxygenase
MLHDFSLTEKHVVFYDLPVTFDTSQAVALSVPRLLRGPAKLALSAWLGRVRLPDPLGRALTRRSRANDRMPYRWDPAYPARIGVMPREGGVRDVRWFEVQPCYVYHPLNAYDEGRSIVLEVVRHAKTLDADLRGPDETDTTLDRWTVDLDAGSIREERLDDRAQEFPRIDERLVGRRHRYGYTLALNSEPSVPSDTVLKHDMLRCGATAHAFGKGRQAGEFIFEPNSRAAAEDDGVLMGFVYDPERDRSDLVLLDAGSLEMLASVHLPVRVPTGFHGNWVACGS